MFELRLLLHHDAAQHYYVFAFRLDVDLLGVLVAEVLGAWLILLLGLVFVLFLCLRSIRVRVEGITEFLI